MQLMHAGEARPRTGQELQLVEHGAKFIDSDDLRAQEGASVKQTTQPFDGRGEPGQSGGRYEAPTMQTQICPRGITRRLARMR